MNPRGDYVSDYARATTRLAGLLDTSGRREAAIEVAKEARSVARPKGR
jgi:hypothetical protein